nr:MAG TPA: hypothetical protein [Caudoviricetes sp.]
MEINRSILGIACRYFGYRGLPMLLINPLFLSFFLLD